MGTEQSLPANTCKDAGADAAKGERRCGTLYLCATPIGNLDDITRRVLDTLASVDLIAAEDTRNSLKLLNRYDIHTPLTSYHEHNKYDKARTLVARLHEGADVALITDAGTPAISDPGEVLVSLSIEEGIPVTSLPGPAACITALTLSGLSARRFVFEGFLPSDRTERKRRRETLTALAMERRTIIVYEAPHHLLRTLSDLYGALGERRVALCRELTKKHETVERMTLSDAIAQYQDGGCEPRGEYVLIIEGMGEEAAEAARQQGYEGISVAAQVAEYEAQGVAHAEAMKRVALERGIPKREVYQALLDEKRGTT